MQMQQTWHELSLSITPSSRKTPHSHPLFPHPIPSHPIHSPRDNVLAITRCVNAEHPRRVARERRDNLWCARVKDLHVAVVARRVQEGAVG